MMGENIPRWLSDVRHGRKPNGEPTPYQFNIDHPFRIGKKSFVFYPYHFNVKQIEPFRQYLEKKGFELQFCNSKYSEYGHDTYKIIIKHIDDDEKLFESGFKKIKDRAESMVLFFSCSSRRGSYSGEISYSSKWRVNYNPDENTYSITDSFNFIEFTFDESLNLLILLKKVTDHNRRLYSDSK